MASAHSDCVTTAMLESVKWQLQKELKSQGELINWARKRRKGMELKMNSFESEMKGYVIDMDFLKDALGSEREKRKRAEMATEKLREDMEELRRDFWNRMKDMTSLRDSLRLESGRRREAEMCVEKFKEDVGELRTECVFLEERLAELEEKLAAPPQAPPWDAILNELKGIMSGVQTKFKEGDEKQEKLEGELETMKEVMKRLTASASAAPAVQLSPEEEVGEFPSPPSSPVHSRGDLSHGVTEVGSVAVQASVSGVREAKSNISHGRDESDPLGLSCLCGSVFSSKNSFGDHIRNFARDKKFSCQFCKKRFSRYSWLRKHLKNGHKNNSTMAGVGCGKCGAVLHSRAQYLDHLKFYHRRGPGSSSEKPAQFSSLGSAAKVSKPKGHRRPTRGRRGPVAKTCLRHGMHYARHLQCLCGTNFADKKKLLRHVKYYSNYENSNIICRFCGKRFAYNCFLKYHLARAHQNPTQVKVEWTDNNGEEDHDNSFK